MKILPLFLSAIALAGLMAGCQTSSQAGKVYSRGEAQTPLEVHYGTVLNVDEVRIEAEETGAGAAIGAIVGGIVGSTIGEGSGRTLATTGGAIVGAATGSAAEKMRGTKKALEIEVELDTGRIMVIVQEVDENFTIQPGDRVRVIESGYGRYRVRD